jgi:hypothetical protein
MAKILLAKYIPGEPLDLRCVDSKVGAYLTKLRESGFLDFVASERPTPEPGKVVVESLEIIGGKVVQSWSIQDEPTPPESV